MLTATAAYNVSLFVVSKHQEYIAADLNITSGSTTLTSTTYTFTAGDVGKSIVSLEHLGFAKDMLDRYDDKIVLPVDFMTADGEKKINEFNDNDIGYDIGSNSIKIFNKVLEIAKSVIFNGPMGLFEDNKYAKGTRMLFKCLDKNKVKTIIGGGDSAAAVNKLGFSDSFYHVSTGGGATMKYLESRSLVGIDVIEDKKVN